MLKIRIGRGGYIFNSATYHVKVRLLFLVVSYMYWYLNGHTLTWVEWTIWLNNYKQSYTNINDNKPKKRRCIYQVNTTTTINNTSLLFSIRCIFHVSHCFVLYLVIFMGVAYGAGAAHPFRNTWCQHYLCRQGYVFTFSLVYSTYNYIYYKLGFSIHRDLATLFDLGLK